MRKLEEVMLENELLKQEVTKEKERADMYETQVRSIVEEVIPIIKEIENTKGIFRVFKIAGLALSLIQVIKEKIDAEKLKGQEG